MKTKSLLILVLAFVVSAAFSQSERFEERIFAVVHDRIITSSEVEVALMMELGGNLPSDTAQILDLMRAKVEDLIDEELILIAAEADSLPVDDARVDEMFRSRWGLLVDGYGGEAALEKALENEGYSVDDFKRKTREQIEAYYLKQMFVEKNFGRIPVTESEVDSFYSTYKDSLPPAPVEVNLVTILLHLEPDSGAIKRALELLSTAKHRITGGEDFATVAAELSEDKRTAPVGGKLGIYGRGDLTPAIDSVAFSISFDEIGGPVRSPMGYHLIKIIDKAAGKASIAHILAEAPLTDERMRELGDIADSIYRVAKEAPEQFEKLVEKFGDICTVELEMLGWVPQAAIQGDFKGEIAKAEVDEIIGPYQVGDYIQIIKIEDRREGRQRTLEEDRELLREGARQMKTRKAIESRLERLREKYYIEIRI